MMARLSSGIFFLFLSLNRTYAIFPLWSSFSSFDPPELPEHEEDKNKEHTIFTEDRMETQRVLSKKAFKNKEALWPKAAVIYKIDDSVDCPYSENCKMLMRAMTHYEERTCVRFKEQSGEKDYVSIFVNENSQSCFSTKGRVGGKQLMSLGRNCWHEGIVIHEMGHALSFDDEMNRPDRDEWIWIFFENILPSVQWAFTKADPAYTNLLEEPFDYKSIMMYDEYGFSKDGTSPTIRAKTNEHLKPIWKKDGLSELDIKKINKLYRCIGSNQKPRFPVDVTCSFDGNPCGFKGIDEYRWSWSPKTWGFLSYQGRGGYLFSDAETAGSNGNYLRSVNFHGLSPLDKDRGPQGCVSFSYKTTGEVSLKLSQTVLDSAQQLYLFYRPEAAEELWSQNKPTDQWFRVIVPLQVTKPFMLMFSSLFEHRENKGRFELDDFELSYSPCTDPRSKSNPTAPPNARGRESESPFAAFSLFKSLSGFFY